MIEAVRHLFDYDASLPLDVRVVGSERRDDAVVTEIRFAAARGGDVAAFVVDAEAAPAGLPGVVYAHGGSEPGKHVFVEQAVELARAGLTVVLPDTSMPSNLPSPERIDEDEHAFGDAVLAQRRALDVLADRGAPRFGHFGHSFGGMQGAVLSAVEPRLDAIVIAGMGAGLVEVLRAEGLTDHAFLARIARLDPVHFVAVPSRRHLLVQQGRADQANRGMLPEAARKLFDAAAPPKQWAEYDCDHGVDAYPSALADRIAFFQEVLARP
jgi:dienelactone hydrolase